MINEDKNQETKESKKDNKDILIGAGAFLSVVALPLTILAGLLLNDRRKK